MKGWSSKVRCTLQRAWLLTALCLPAVLTAQVSFYGVDTTNTLWKINALNQTAVSIGSTGLGSTFIEGLAVSASGALYGTDEFGGLYSFNTLTGAATFIGSTGRSDIEALHFVGSTLVGASFTSQSTLFSINTSTAGTANIVTLASSMAGVPRAMTVLDSNTVLLSTFASPDNLYSVNLTTGAVTLVGSLAVTPGQFLGMDFGSNGIFYGFNGDGNLYQINPATGAVTLLGNTGGQFWLDATALIPEPSTWALLGLGTALLLAGRRRMRG